MFCDFDGTLAEIVMDPTRARPVYEAAEATAELAKLYARVGVLSGRPLDFLTRFFDPSIFIAGLYGLEVLSNGRREDHPQAGAWREAIDDVVACSRDRGPEGMRVESKGFSMTLHYRETPELADAVADWAARQAARSGLRQRPARKSVELHPPIEADKGTALCSAAEGLEAVCYIGDDVGDLPAFDALDALAADGVDTVRVAVRSEEVASEVTERADLVLADPSEVVQLLHELAHVDR